MSESDQLEQKSAIDFKAVNPSSHEEEQLIEIWGRVTDPKRHNPKKFRYLVHAFNPSSSRIQQLGRIYAESSGVYQSDKSQGDQSINLFNEPERLGERVSLSMSLIDQDHTGTWGEGGLIVEAPEENIVFTSPTDTGAVNFSKEFLKRQAHNHPPLSADELLKLTSPHTYNEVVAFAKSESGKTLKLVGFFIKVDKDGQPIDPVVAEKMRQRARKLNLPLVEIQVQGRFEQEPFEIGKNKNEIWANYNGKRYNLGSDNPELAFNAYDFRGDQFFPSPEEIEEVITHFTQRGDISEAQAQQIRERYKIADSQRKSPKIEYDPESQEISGVTVREGYGKDERQYRINRSGYCWDFSIRESRRILKESSLNGGRIEDSYEPTPLSSSQVLQILESRKEMIEPVEYEKILNFFNHIRDKIDSVYDQHQSYRRKRRLDRF